MALVASLPRSNSSLFSGEVFFNVSTFLLVICLFFPSVGHAATLWQLVAVLSDTVQRGDSPGSWTRVGKLPGVNWKSATPKPSPAGQTWFGDVKLDGIGNVTVFFTGTKARAQQLYFAFPEGVDKPEFTSTLTRLMPTTKIRRLRGGCMDDGVVSGSAVYQLDKPGNASVFAMMISGTSRAGLDTELFVGLQAEKHWKCPSS